MRQPIKEHESLLKYVPCSCRVTKGGIQKLNQFSIASSKEKDSLETSCHTQLPPFRQWGHKKTSSNLPSSQNIVHHRCREADKGAVLCSVVWTKPVISLRDNLEGLKWYLAGLVKSCKSFCFKTDDYLCSSCPSLVCLTNLRKLSVKAQCLHSDQLLTLYVSILQQNYCYWRH